MSTAERCDHQWCKLDDPVHYFKPQGEVSVAQVCGRVELGGQWIYWQSWTHFCRRCGLKRHQVMADMVQSIAPPLRRLS